MDSLDFSKIREFSLSSKRKKWYRELRAACDEGCNLQREPLAIVKKYPEVLETLKLVAPNYYKGKKGVIFTAGELYALAYPELLNTCQVCGVLVGYNIWGGKTWYKGCCVAHGTKAGMVDARSRFVEKHGVDNPMKLETVKKAQQLTCMKRYGVGNVLKNKDVYAKGVNTLESRYGVRTPLQNAVIKQRKEDTCVERYGVPHNTQNPEILEKMLTSRSTSSEKWYTDKWGVNHKVIGYEDKALYFFDNVAHNIVSLTTKTSKLPRYRYKDPIDGKLRNYFPDMLVCSKTKNYIVEVKSIYTLNLDIEKNLKKFLVANKSCKRKNMQFVLLVYKGGNTNLSEKPIIIRNPNKRKLKRLNLI
jgi:hypothetical protein